MTKEQAEKTIKEMMKDFMFYGYDFQSFLDKKYPIAETFTKQELKEMWTGKKEIEGSNF